MPQPLTGNVLALDLATKLGWAVNAPHEDAPDFGTYVLPSTGDNVGRFTVEYAQWLRETIDVQKPALVIYEQPTQFASIIAAEKVWALIAITQYVCEKRQLRRNKVHSATIKKFFTGYGRAKKDDMIAAARRRGWKVRDDNQADACAIWAYAVFCFAAPEHRARFQLGELGAVA